MAGRGWELVDKAGGWEVRALTADMKQKRRTGSGARLWTLKPASSDELPPARLHFPNLLNGTNNWGTNILPEPIKAREWNVVAWNKKCPHRSSIAPCSLVGAAVGRFRSCDLAGEVCHWSCTLRVHNLTPLAVLFLLPIDSWRCDFSIPWSCHCTCGCYHASLTWWTFIPLEVQTQINSCFYNLPWLRYFITAAEKLTNTISNYASA